MSRGPQFRRRRGFAAEGPSGRLAFTFLEMMVVIVILGTLLILTIPTMRRFHNQGRLQASARQLGSLLRGARGQAILLEKTVEVRMDVTDGRYRLDLDPTFEERGTRRRRRERQWTDMERIRSLPKDVSFSDIFVWSEQVYADGRVAFEFYPNGSATPAFVTLKDKKGRTMYLELSRASGQCRVSRKRPESIAVAAKGAVAKEEVVVEE